MTVYLSGHIHSSLQAEKCGGRGRLQCANIARSWCPHPPATGSKSVARFWTALGGGALSGIPILFPCSCGVSNHRAMLAKFKLTRIGVVNN